MFDDYHLINYHVQKEDAQTILQNASAIFLLGGDTLKQNEFLIDYELTDLIKKSTAVVMGQAQEQSIRPLNGYARKTLVIQLKKLFIRRDRS